MGAEGAVPIIFRKQIQEAENPVVETRKLIAEYNQTFAHPYIAAGLGYLDDV
jgi:propionyl-CoA carboxylase beta chain